MELTEQEIAQLDKHFKRRSREGWTGKAFLRAVEVINGIRVGSIQMSDWFYPDLVTVEDFIYDLNLTQFL